MNKHILSKGIPMADIEKGSVYMGGVDKAAMTIESVLNGQITDIIETLRADGVISNMEAQHWKKRCTKVGAGVVSDIIGLHDDMTQRLKDLDIDVPPPSDGTAEFIQAMGELVVPFSGSR